ncbi:hypothetical protein [Streptomyces prunicolor]|jgi:hypothetical protein|uniref:hypothetical protein n=1 Tax=Streptomyces prunicolor TaxID=67348 RepID=UPI0003A7023E|nr:hypothetical protein [Streptomyces prunicolor]
MRMRSALTTSVLAVGILLGGAGAALAHDNGPFPHDDGALVQGTGSQGSGHVDNTMFAGVIDHVGPVYSSTTKTDHDWDRGTFEGIFGF